MDAVASKDGAIIDLDADDIVVKDVALDRPVPPGLDAPPGDAPDLQVANHHAALSRRAAEPMEAIGGDTLSVDDRPGLAEELVEALHQDPRRDPVHARFTTEGRSLRMRVDLPLDVVARTHIDPRAR